MVEEKEGRWETTKEHTKQGEKEKRENVQNRKEKITQKSAHEKEGCSKRIWFCSTGTNLIINRWFFSIGQSDFAGSKLIIYSLYYNNFVARGADFAQV